MAILAWCLTATDNSTDLTDSVTGALTTDTGSEVFYFGFLGGEPAGSVIYEVYWQPVDNDGDAHKPSISAFGGGLMVLQPFSSPLPWRAGVAIIGASVNGVTQPNYLRIVFSDSGYGGPDPHLGVAAWDVITDLSTDIGWHAGNIVNSPSPVFISSTGVFEVSTADVPTFYGGTVTTSGTTFSTEWIPLTPGDRDTPPTITHPNAFTIGVTPDVSISPIPIFLSVGTLRITGTHHSEVLVIVFSNPNTYGSGAYGIDIAAPPPPAPPPSSGGRFLPMPWVATVKSRDRRVLSDLTGLRQTRNIQRDRYEQQQLQFVFYRGDEVQYFYEWVKDELLDGALWFRAPYWPHPSGDGEHKLRRFIKVPTYPKLMGDGVWQVECIVEIRGASAFPLDPDISYPQDWAAYSNSPPTPYPRGTVATGPSPSPSPPPPSPPPPSPSPPSPPPPSPTPPPPPPSPSPSPPPPPPPPPPIAPGSSITLSNIVTTTGNFTVDEGTTVSLTITATTSDAIGMVYTSTTPLGSISGSIGDFALINIPSDISSIHIDWIGSSAGSITFTISW